jgi:hypothetical protein
MTNSPIYSGDVEAAPADQDIGDLHTSFGRQLGETAAQTLSESPAAQTVRLGALGSAEGKDQDIDPFAGEIGGGVLPGSYSPPQLSPEIAIADAQKRVKDSGLANQIKLPDQPTMRQGALDLMIQHARAEAERQNVIDRGPQGFIPSALDATTSLFVSAVDPLNIAAFSVPVMSEARVGMLMERAGGSVLARAGVRAGVGAAQGVVGSALLTPLEWASRTEEGQDYTFSDALSGMIQTAGAGALFHAGVPLAAESLRRWRGRPLEGEAPPPPIGPEPLAGAPSPVAEPFPETGVAPSAMAEPFAAPEEPPVSRETPSVDTSPMAAAFDALPDRVKEDMAHIANADLISGRPVQAAEILQSVAANDPRIAEALAAFDRDPSAQAVLRDVRDKLIASGMDSEQATANATVWAARYGARAARLGGGESALDLYKSEGVEIAQGASALEGRSFNQPLTVPTFHSAVERAVAGARLTKASPEQWAATLRNTPGVKPEEMKWLGLEDWLKEQNGAVSKEDVAQYVNDNNIQVQEVEKQAFAPSKPAWDLVEGTKPGETKYQGYTLPGGENYRELLLTLPETKPEVSTLVAAHNKLFTLHDQLRAWDTAHPDEDHPTSPERLRLVAARNAAGREHDAIVNSARVQDYKSAHWDEPNILAHIRFDDRTIDGEKALHIAEVQSDFGQATRKQKLNIVRAVKQDFDAIVERMEKAGILTKVCD